VDANDGEERYVHNVYEMMIRDGESATERMRMAKKWWADLGGSRLEWPAAARPGDTRVSRVGQIEGRAWLDERVGWCLKDLLNHLFLLVIHQ
jgi:hypothetical protein